MNNEDIPLDTENDAKDGIAAILPEKQTKN